MLLTVQLWLDILDLTILLMLRNSTTLLLLQLLLMCGCHQSCGVLLDKLL